MGGALFNYLLATLKGIEPMEYAAICVIIFLLAVLVGYVVSR